MSDYLFHNAFYTVWYHFQDTFYHVLSKTAKIAHAQGTRKLHLLVLLLVLISNQRTMPEFLKILIGKIILLKVEMKVCDYLAIIVMS